MDKTITITVDDQQRTIHTFASSVSGALESAGLQAGDQDALAPSAGSAIQDGSRIVLQRGRPLALTVDGTQHEVWTTALAVGTALQEVGMRTPENMELSTKPSRRIPLDGMAIVVRSTKPITLLDGGEPAKQIQSTALSVGDLLTQQGIPLGDSDTVTPGRTSPVLPGMTVEITRIRIAELSEKRAIDPPVKAIRDSSLPAGRMIVENPGMPGEELVTYRVTLANGQETARHQIATQQITPPRPARVRVGGAERSVANYAAGNGSVWDRLARCESGGNWAANSGNGYYGGLQFDKSTWSAHGGNKYAAYPNQASREEQIEIAKRVRESRGNYRAWPTCSARIGLS